MVPDGTWCLPAPVGSPAPALSKVAEPPKAPQQLLLPLH